MFTSKKQILLTFTIAMVSLGLTASHREQETKLAGSRQGYLDWIKQTWSKPNKKMAQLGERISNAPPEIRSLITELDENDQYKPYHTLKKSAALLAFNDQGTALTSVDYAIRNTIEVIKRNVKNGSVINRFTANRRPRENNDLLLSGDGTTLVVNEKIINTATGSVIETVPFHSLSINHDGTMLAAILPIENIDEDLLVEPTELPQFISLFNRNTKTRVQLESDASTKHSPKFSRDGTIFACASGSNILLFDTQTGKVKKTINASEISNATFAHISSLALNNSLSLLAYSTSIYNTGLRAYHSTKDVVLVDLKTDQKRILKGTSFLPLITGLAAYVEEVGFTNRHNKLYISSLTDPSDATLSVEFLDLETGAVTQNIQVSKQKGYTRIRSIALSPDDKMLAIGTTENIELWKKPTTPLQERAETEQRILELRAAKEEKERRPMKNVFFQAAMKQARQKKSASAPIGSSSPYSSEPAVEEVD